MIKVFRPFWSYDVKKTEKWLSEMAKKGYYLESLNRWTRNFTFDHSEPKSIVYRIGYDKMSGDSISKSLVTEGWSKLVQAGNWYVMSNHHPSEEIKTTSVREGIIKHNRKITYIFSGIFIYLTCIAIFNLLILGVGFSSDAPVEVVESPMWILTYTFIGIAFMTYGLSIYSIFKINKTNRDFINDKPTDLQGDIHNEGKLSKTNEKGLKKAGQIIVRRKYGWMYAPDQLEKWLESMEEHGFNLYRVSKTGTTFFFTRGIPRKVSYCADYQNISDESYFDIHIDAGWKSMFRSFSSIQKWTIWSREYSVGEDRPQLYSDKTHHLTQARRVAIAYTALFLPLVIMYMFNIVLFIENLLHDDSTKLSLINTVLFIITILMFGSFTVRTWLYYMRLRKRYEYQL